VRVWSMCVRVRVCARVWSMCVCVRVWSMCVCVRDIRGHSEHPVAFMGGRVCDDVTALGRRPLPIGCSGGRGVLQMERHLLGDEGVQVDVVETVPTVTTRLRSGGAVAC
jgi:hypothetical protein